MTFAIFTPNHMDDAIDLPVIGGAGTWEVNSPLSNLNSEFFIDSAQSTNATLASTQFDVDFGIAQQFKFFGLLGTNFSRSAKVKVRGSNTVAWANVTVNGVNSVGATTLNISTGITVVTIAAGDYLTIAGDTTRYKVVTGAVVGVSSTGSVTISRIDDSGTGLAVATTGSEVITCHTGDYSGSNALLDTDFEDVFDVVYPWGSKPWGSLPWDGKFTEKDFVRLNLPKDYTKVLTDYTTVQYIRVEIDDTTNTDGFVRIAAFYACDAFLPDYNMNYGVSFGLRPQSTFETAVGGVSTFDKHLSQRFISLTLEHQSDVKAFSQYFDMIRQTDIYGNVYVMYDDEDTVYKLRRCFPARFENLNPISQQFYQLNTMECTLVERLG